MHNPKILLTILPMFWPKFPPLGLAYLQAYLMDKGMTADILDLNHTFYSLAGPDLKKEWLVSVNTFLEKKIIPMIQENFRSEFESIIQRMLAYDIVGFSCFKSNFENTLEVIRMLKAAKPELKIVLGGPEILRQYHQTGGSFSDVVNTLANYIVVGEGEESLYEFVSGQTGSNHMVLFSQVKDLSSIPYPKFEGVDFNAYARHDGVPIVFSRGCVRRCDFCSERLIFKGYRTRSVEGLLDEIDFHRRERNIRYFIFFDSMLNGDLRQLERLCDGIIARFGSVHWEAQMAVRYDMDTGIMDKMKRSGCYNLFIGLESGSDRTLEKMNKGFTAKEAQDFFKKLRSAGLNFGVSMMVGYPGETREDFEVSLNFIVENRELIPKIEQVNPFTYYEGTVADRRGDYRLNRESLERLHIFVEEIAKYKIRYTKAFIGNLIEKNLRVSTATPNEIV